MKNGSIALSVRYLELIPHLINFQNDFVQSDMLEMRYCIMISYNILYKIFNGNVLTRPPDESIHFNGAD